MTRRVPNSALPIVRFLIGRNAGWESNLVQDYVEETLSEMQKSVESSRLTEHKVPPPMTAHPALESYATFVRNFDQNLVRLPRVGNPSILKTIDLYGRDSEPTLSDNFVMTRRRCTALMPYVGEPHEMKFYVWPVWLDDLNRHISGDVEIHQMYRKN